MAKIHITLVGGQTTPVYQGILHVNPDRVILIHSQQSENEANRIYAEVDVNCELRRFDPVDLRKINDAILNIKNSLSDTDDISINVSSGTKMWSLLFYSMFIDDANATLFVIDQNNKVWNLKTHESADTQFDMDVQFRLLGNPLKRFSRFEDYSEADKQACASIRSIRSVNSQDFYNLTKVLYDNPDRNYVCSSGGSFIKRKPDENSYQIELKGKTGTKSIVLSSLHIDSLVLNTGWFEFEIANLLSNWSKVREMRMNCVFPALNETNKNEIDIIVNTGTKLLFVECKTSVFDNTTIDKFASAVKVYGGLGSKALFVTDIPMNEKGHEKCADHGIMHYSLQSKPPGKSHCELLYEMLDRELVNLNVK
jgi:hypothetical protein